MPRSSMLALLPLLAACSEYEIVDFENVEVYHQDPAEQVDILMVIDNSCSMGPYQVKLGQNFEQFITYFIDATIDYHIGVTTTTLEPPEFQQGVTCSQSEIDAIPPAGALVDGTVITEQTDDAADVFNDLVNVGTCGAGFEMGLEAGRLAFADDNLEGANFGFLRPDASLSLIFVSDEQDGSPDPVSTYINDFFDIKGHRSRDVFNASALAVTDTEPCGSLAAGSTLGTRYVDVADQTHGVVGNLCAHDFESIVTELSLNASRLRDTFFLEDLPHPPSLHVYVEDEEVPCDEGAWTYQLVDDQGVERPAVVFERLEMPRPGEQVAIRYDAGGGDPSLFCTDGGDTGGAR